MRPGFYLNRRALAFPGKATGGFGLFKTYYFQTMFRINGLRHRYDAQNLITFPDWQSAQGDAWLLTGASGSGKTTLLHILAGLRRPTAGSVNIGGTDMYALPGSQADRFRGRNIGLVLQKPHLLATLTVAENLSLAQYLAGLPPDRQRIEEVLQALEMTGKQNARPHQLSQGQAQRVAIARAVLNRPKLLLADEPTSSLDNGNALKVLQLIESQAATCGATLVIATHDARIKDRISRQFHLQASAAEIISE